MTVRPGFFLAIQVVDVHYDKTHRGGAGARVRVGLPRGFTLPIVGEHGVLHQCRMHGWRDFAPQDAAEQPLIREGATTFQTTWRVELRPDEVTLHRALPRIAAPTLLAVPHDRWARVRDNWREHSHEQAWFCERTINFGGFRSQPTTDIFLGEPDLCLDLRSDLLRSARRGIRRG